MSEGTWALQDAKNQFSRVVRAAQYGPQVVTRHGVPRAVVLSVEAFERLQRGAPPASASLAELILAMPQGGEVEFERVDVPPREFEP